jgi:hypothetical protein
MAEHSRYNVSGAESEENEIGEKVIRPAKVKVGV